MKNFKWPGNAKAAVTLTYDDGLKSQLENALPDLDRHGIKATFFPSGAALTDKSKRAAWAGVVASGHEIGCHTLNHPCSLAHDFVRKGFGLQDYTMDRMRAEIEENKRIISTFGYKSDKYVFAYPCGESALGPGMEQSYKPLISEMFLAARGVKQEYAIPGQIEMMDVPCFEANTGADGMIKIIEKAKETGGWAVILFHGIGADYISVTAEDHRKFVEYLSKNKNALYIDTFGKTAECTLNNR
jgi:peptidoglycan/xylan/chitin deacetylase (PgdA/CDA1 family)